MSYFKCPESGSTEGYAGIRQGRQGQFIVESIGANSPGTKSSGGPDMPGIPMKH